MSASPGDSVLHPCALGALLLLVLNDHALKDLYPGWLTGKLSDAAGLVLLPLVLLAVGERLAGRVLPRRSLAWLCAASALGFAVCKSTHLGAEAFRVGLAFLQWPLRAAGAALRGHRLPAVGRVSFARDATDLFALPAVLVALAAGWRRAGAGLPLRSAPEG